MTTNPETGYYPDGDLDPGKAEHAPRNHTCCSCGLVVYKRALTDTGRIWCVPCWDAVKDRRSEQEARDRLEAEADCRVTR